MAKQNILIVDSDPESVKVLEVSLKKAGYSVTTAQDGAAALELFGFSTPDLVISDTQMPGLDGFDLCTKLKENEEWTNIPFIFLTADKSIENKIRGLELGVDDYLNKPIFIREILVRVNLAIQRRQKERLELRGTKSKFSGNLQDMGIVDLLQTIDLGHKSGVLHVFRLNDDGFIYFKDGRVIDASTRSRICEDAVYRMLVWSEGTFEIEFTNVDRPERIRLSTQGLLMEGMRRLDEWGRLQEQLPALTSIFDIDEEVLAERLGEIPDEVNSVLRHFDGRATLLEVVDNGALGDLEALTLISKLYFEGLITEIHPSQPVVDSVLESDALVPKSMDAWLHSRPPQQHIPARVVDDTPGPHLSTAAQFAGLPETPSVIASAPVLIAPAVSVSAPMDGTDAEKNSDAPLKESATASPFAPSYSYHPDSASEDAAGSFSSDNKTRPLLSTDRPDPEKIARAIDAEVPPPDESAEDVPRDEDPAYFNGSAYRASLLSRPSYDPEPGRYSDDALSAPPAEEERPSSSDSRQSSPQDADFDDEWPEEEEDPPEVPKNRMPLVAAALVGVLAVAGGAYWFLSGGGADEKSVSASTPDSSKSLDKKDAVRTPSKESVAPIAKEPAGSDSNAASVGESASMAAASPIMGEKADTETEEKASSDTGAATASENADAPGSAASLPKKTLTPEQKKEFERLMDTARNVGPRKKVALYRQALEIDPTSDTASAALAIQLLEFRQARPEALVLAEKAVSLNSDNAMGWMAKGYILQLDGKAEEAKEAYRRCAECSGPADYTLECRRLSR